MERLLASRYFRRSRRLPSFLRYVVQHALDGLEDQLKERVIGAEVFGRSVDYDTSGDSIVRVTAAEIRKRVAQYYQDPGHEGEVLISFTPGSYAPQFHFPNQLKEDGSATTTSPGALSHQLRSNNHRHLWYGFSTGFVISAIIVVGTILIWRATRTTPFDFFWRPTLISSSPVLLCVADQEQYTTFELYDSNNLIAHIMRHDDLAAVVMSDLGPITHIAALLQSNGKKYNLNGESNTTLTNLRAGPDILIGAFDNTWTLRLTRSLHYHFMNDSGMTEFGIADGHNPSHAWTVTRQQQIANNNYKDYAIIARFSDSITGQPTVVIAGIGSEGTIAASEFLTDRTDLARIMRADKAAGSKPNMEIVISTSVINGDPSAPNMVAAYYW